MEQIKPTYIFPLAWIRFFIIVFDIWLLLGALLYFISLYFLGVFDKKIIKALFPKRKKQDRIEIDTFE